MPRYSFMRGVLDQDHRLKGSAKFISGDPQSRRVKNVCRRCNNGWMSVLQEHTKPIIIPLLKGDTTLLNSDRQNTLATWAAMTVSAEYIETKRAAISI